MVFTKRPPPPPPPLQIKKKKKLITYQRYFEINFHVTHKVRVKGLCSKWPFLKINDLINNRNIALLNSSRKERPPYLGAPDGPSPSYNATDVFISLIAIWKHKFSYATQFGPNHFYLHNIYQFCFALSFIIGS